MKQYFDNTKLGDYKKCPRYYYLRHVRGWRPSGTATALIFGLAWHEAMNAIWAGHSIDDAMTNAEQVWVKEGLKPFKDLNLQDLEMLGPRTPMILKEMLYEYLEKREAILDNATLLAAEKPFAVPLYPDRDDIWYIGRRDKDVKINGDIVIIEHKTTTEYKVDGGFKTQYLESWYPNSQCSGYLYAAHLEYGSAKYVWVDAALVHKKVHNCFKFIPISATFNDMDAWLWEAQDWASRISSELERLVDSEGQKVLAAFPKNTEQCVGKYGVCSMISICRGFANPALLEDAPAGYVHEVWNPFELLHIAELGLKEA